MARNGRAHRRLQRIVCQVVAGEDEFLAQTSLGTARGAPNSRGGAVWKGLPYARPPVGDLRFRKPLPAEPWQGVRECLQFGSRAMQADIGMSAAEDNTPMSEDCLYLNIWRPKGSTRDSRLPVFFWIHGGGLLVGAGSEPQYDGSSFADQGLVVVTINYRMGAFGFLPTAGGDQNCGYWDQVEALKWVQREIHAFGGDPKNVTIAGESAGAISATALCSSQKANTLFQKAILMSTLSWAWPRETGDAISADFARAAGAKSNSAAELRKLPARELQDQSLTARTSLNVNSTPGWIEQVATGPPERMKPIVTSNPDGTFTRPHRGIVPIPVVDGDFFEEPVLDALRAGAARHLKVMVGSNREENGFREDSKNRPGWPQPLTYGGKVRHREDVVQRCARELGGMGTDGQPLLDIAERLVRAYSAHLGVADGEQEQQAWQNLWNLLASDLSFNSLTVMVADRLRRHQPETYVYRFDGFKGKAAYHGWELGYVFNNLVPAQQKRPEAVELAATMHAAWASFCKFGNPSVQGRLPQWEPYSAQKDAMMIFDVPCRLDTYTNDRPCIRLVTEQYEKFFKVQPLA